VAKCKTESQNRKRQHNHVFVCCILSHGHRDTVIGTDGNDVKIEEILCQFDGKTCEHLRGKPKIFMIQACQGGMFNCIIILIYKFLPLFCTAKQSVKSACLKYLYLSSCFISLASAEVRQIEITPLEMSQ